MKEKFTIEGALKAGWEVMKKNIALFIGIMVVVFILRMIPAGIGRLVGSPGMMLIVNLGFMILNMGISIGLIKIALNFVDGKEVKMEQLFAYFNLVWKFFLGSVLYGLIVLGGLLLLIVPGIIWGIKYQFFSYYIADQGMDPLDAIKASGKVTNGSKGNLFILGLVFLLVNFLGAIALLVGLFVTIPVTMVAMAYVFRKLNAASGEETKIPKHASPSTPNPETPSV